jgi:NADH-quinone oxidoreductase subunit E
LRGADQFVDHVCHKLGVDVGETTEDGLFTVQRVMCIAACDKAPIAQINLEYYENLDPEEFDTVLEKLKNAATSNQEETGANSDSRD